MVLSPPRVTVLSSNPPQHLVRHRSCIVHNELAYNDAAQGPLSQPPVPSPGGQPLHPQSCSDESYEQWSQAALACSDRRNGCPERQALCKITESFLASATRALPLPDRLAIARAQSFKREALLTRDRITTAASYNKVRASVSPTPRYSATAIDFDRLILPRREPEVRAYGS
jgi:hypothetical protein